MHDFKIRTDLALFSMLNVKQFSFESLNGEKKEKKRTKNCFNRRQCTYP